MLIYRGVSTLDLIPHQATVERTTCRCQELERTSTSPGPDNCELWYPWGKTNKNMGNPIWAPETHIIPQTSRFFCHRIFPTQIICFFPNNISSSWWFQPIWKNVSQIWSFPQVGVKIKNIWNHHPVFIGGWTKQSPHLQLYWKMLEGGSVRLEFFQIFPLGGKGLHTLHLGCPGRHVYHCMQRIWKNMFFIKIMCSSYTSLSFHKKINGSSYIMHMCIQMLEIDIHMYIYIYIHLYILHIHVYIFPP